MRIARYHDVMAMQHGTADQESRSPTPRPGAEQRIVLHGVEWKTYLMLNDAVDTPGVRMAYCEGALEIMTVSPEHETLKKMLARLLELFALERGVPLYGYGQTTFRKEAKKRGLEPDECYCVGAALRNVPDIAVEIALTSGGVDKLSIYEGLGVAEVWIWEDGRLTVHALSATGYEARTESALVPGLDFEVFSRFIVREDQPQAALEFRAWTQGQVPSK